MRRRNVAYIRVANKDDYEVQKEKQLLEYYAETNNFKIDYYYIDNGYSGTTLDRPGLRQMLRDVKSKKITNRIVYTNCARLGRDLKTFFKITDQLSKGEFKLVPTTDNISSQLDMIVTLQRLVRNDNKKRRMTAQRLIDERNGRYKEVG